MIRYQRRQWHPTPVLLPGKYYGRSRSLVGCSPWGLEELDTTEATQQQHDQIQLPRYRKMTSTVILNFNYTLESSEKLLKLSDAQRLLVWDQSQVRYNFKAPKEISVQSLAPRAIWSSSAGKEFACNAGDPSSIPESRRSTGEGIGYPLQYSWVSLVAQLAKNHLQCRRPGFDPQVGKIPWRTRLPTTVFWPRKFQ